MKVDVNLIDPNPEQPRVDFDPDELAGLAQSIARLGVINPVVVYQEGERYVLVDGERRLRAAIMAGLTEIPVSVRLPDQDDHTRLALALAANLQRDDLNPIEEARAYRRMVDEFGMKQTEISELTGKAQSVISMKLSLLELDEPIQNLIASGAFTGDWVICKALLDIPDAELRISLARRYAMRKSSKSHILSGLRRVGEGRQRRTKLINRDAGPALYVAQNRGMETGKLANLDQATVEQAVVKTCRECPLVDVASESTCRECPLVQFLANLRGKDE